AVRRRLRRGGGADIAAGAGAGLHEHRLAPGFAQLLRHDAAERIDGAAGGERDDDAHGAVGIGLRGCRRRRFDKCRPERHQDPCHGHTSVPPALLPDSALPLTAGLVPVFDANVYHRRRETQPRTRRKSTVSIWENVGASEATRQIDPRTAEAAHARSYAAYNARAM